MILVNGAVSEVLPAMDRGLAYGDGVFRTLRLRGGHPLAWRDHYRKLSHDCAALAIPCPADEMLEGEISRVAAQEPEGVAKVIVTRGTGRRGYASGHATRPTRLVMSFPAPAVGADVSRAGIRARICALRLAHQPALAGIKHLNRLENVLARREWSDPDIAEGLLLDHAGHVIGGTMSNLFIVENGALATPDLRSAGVAGVSRERVLRRAAQSGVACSVCDIPLDRVRRADEVFVVNSVIGVWPLRELDGRTWTPGPCAERARQWLDEAND